MQAALAHCAEAASDKNAEDLIVLDLRGLSDVADFFVICHGSSDRQARAIAEQIEAVLQRELGLRASHVEGRRTGEWILIDYVDFVAHFFVADIREFFRLERLWGDAPRVDPLASDLRQIPDADRPPVGPERGVRGEIRRDSARRS